MIFRRDDEQYTESFPVNTVKRMPTYLRLVKSLSRGGRDVVSSAHLARDLDLDPIQVRKDLQMTGVVGKPKIGYSIPEIIKSIENFLGWDVESRAFLVGAGNLGAAIIGYEGFKEYGLDIVAAFDSAPEKVGQTVHGCEILPLEKLADLGHRMHAHIGILTVPASAAQATADLMYFSGIRAIWNFAPVKLSMPEDVVVENVLLSSSLAVLTSKMKKYK